MGKYHDILGVSSTASEEEIKRAYKQKVKENHPDLHPDDPEAAERIKEINEAYSGLKDGLHGPQPEPNVHSRGRHPFEEMMRAAGAQFRRAHATMQQQVQIPLSILRNGGKFTVEVGVPVQHGHGFRFVGVQKTIQVEPNTAIGSTVEIEVGHEDWNSTAKLIVLPALPEGYEFQAPNDLAVPVEVDVFKMILGGKHSLRLPWGKTVSVKIPKGTTAGQQIRLKGLGVNHVTYGTGDLYVFVVPDIPTLTDDQCDILSGAVKKFDE